MAFQCLQSTSRATKRAAPHLVRQSHIGRAAIAVPAPVVFSFVPDPPRPSTAAPLRRNRRLVNIEGPKGRVQLELFACVQTTPSLNKFAEPRTTPQTLKLNVRSPENKEQRAAWGLTRALMANAVKGVTDGHDIEINLVGVGYRVTLDPPPKDVPLGGKSSGRPTLNFKLGFSHPVLVPVPEGIEAVVQAPTRLVLRGASKEAIASIRQWRKPEPYNGKGIFVGGETIKRKEIKKK